MAKDEATPISKTRMNTPAHNDAVDWHLIAEQCFEDIEDLNDLVQDWDFEFHQLKAGRSPAELSAVSRPGFKGYSLSISEALFDEVAASCGLQVEVSIGTVQQVLHCSRSNINTLRRELRRASRSLAQIKTAANSSETLRELEFNLVRNLLLAITGSQPTDRLKQTNRKQSVLQGARDYMEANANNPTTVLELAQASGSCVRTLEYVFRDHFDVTPKAYLKSRRLVAVRHELLRSLRTKPLINEIANRWGFWHMSQFATDYRRFFGELPSETLRTM